MYISKIRKIAPDTDNAAAKRLPMAVALRGANSPKLMKTTISQKTMIASNARETEAFDCSYIDGGNVADLHRRSRVDCIEPFLGYCELIGTRLQRRRVERARAVCGQFNRAARVDIGDYHFRAFQNGACG